MTRLKAARKIFKAFPTEAARARLMALRRPDGTPPRVWAVARLCSPTLKDDREALIERACRENWSEYDAKDKLKASRGVDPLARTGGRKHKPPRSLSLGLARWQRQADELIRSVEAVIRPEVIAGLLASPDVAEVTVERILDVRRTVERALAAVRGELGMLDRIVAALSRSESASSPSEPTPVADTKTRTSVSKAGRPRGRSRGSSG